MAWRYEGCGSVSVRGFLSAMRRGDIERCLPGLLFFAQVILSAPVLAGLPRGVVLIADEQIADDKTGDIIARGHAEIISDTYRIRGDADAIEIRPAINEILFKGSAQLTAGKRRYSSETLSCTLDFSRCVSVEADQPLPASALGRADMTPR